MALALLAVWLFFWGGRFLLVQDRFKHAEVALVLSGDPVGRALTARDLYQAGKVDQIWIIPEPSHPTDQPLIQLGLKDPESPPISVLILKASGVPDSSIVLFSAPKNGTTLEARFIRGLLQGRPVRQLVLITSPVASRRALFIFRRVLRHQKVELISNPAMTYDPFESVRWWASPRNAWYVVAEYEKLLINALTLAFEV